MSVLASMSEHCWLDCRNANCCVKKPAVEDLARAGITMDKKHTHTTVSWPFFRDHPGEPVPEENFWTSWCKGRLTEADTLTIRLGATPSGLTSAHLHHPPKQENRDA